MQFISLDRIYDELAQHDNCNTRYARNRYCSSFEERPVYAQSPLNYVAGDSPQQSYCR